MYICALRVYRWCTHAYVVEVRAERIIQTIYIRLTAVTLRTTPAYPSTLLAALNARYVLILSPKRNEEKKHETARTTVRVIRIPVHNCHKTTNSRALQLRSYATALPKVQRLGMNCFFKHTRARNAASW